MALVAALGSFTSSTIGALRALATNSSSASRMRGRVSSTGAALCVAAAYTAHGGDPPARLVSLIGHAIRLHGFLNHPFAGHGAKSRSRRRGRPGPMSSPA